MENKLYEAKLDKEKITPNTILTQKRENRFRLIHPDGEQDGRGSYKKKRIAIFTLYCKEGASSNFRILMYVDDLRKNFHVDVFPFWDKTYVTKYMYEKKKYVVPVAAQYIGNCVKRIFDILACSQKYDVIILQKGVIPALPCTFVGYMKKKGCKVIFDVDDAIYLNINNKMNHSNRIAREVDLVIAGNDLLKKHYIKYNQNTMVLPTVDYSPIYKRHIRDTYENKWIGWIGSQSTIDNLEIVKGAITKVIERHPEVGFSIISNTAAGYDKSIPNTKFIPWTLDGYIPEISKFSVGIMPLYDNAYNRGKCGFKLIQYMNVHKPVIASPVGINEEIVGHCGLIARNEDEWVECLEKLLFDRQQYQACVDHMEEEFERRFSYESNLTAWEKIIRTI